MVSAITEAIPPFHLFRVWRLDVTKPAGWHPELDRDTCRRLRRGTGEPDIRSPVVKHPCDDLADRRPGRPDAARRPIRSRFAMAHKAGQLPCGPSHQTESATLRSSETF